jgi:hypothetical protein
LEINGVSGSRIDASGMPGGSSILPLVDHEVFWETISGLKLMKAVAFSPQKGVNRVTRDH